MVAAKLHVSNKNTPVSEEQRMILQPTPVPLIEEQLILALGKKKSHEICLQADENGNVVYDKDHYPQIHDWVLHG